MNGMNTRAVDAHALQALLPVDRRHVLLVGAASVLAAATPSFAQSSAKPLSFEGFQQQLIKAVWSFTGGATVNRGEMRIDVAELVENGNTVPIEVEVTSPMTAANHVKRIGIFNERNPGANMALFQLSPASGRARVSTRLRLATSQTMVAVAQLSDGSFIGASADVIVTLAACVEEAPGS